MTASVSFKPKGTTLFERIEWWRVRAGSQIGRREHQSYNRCDRGLLLNFFKVYFEITSPGYRAKLL